MAPFQAPITGPFYSKRPLKNRHFYRKNGTVSDVPFIGKSSMKKLLNVGGGDKSLPLPPVYEGWEHVLLDIDPRGAPDVVCDAREMPNCLPAGIYDAVYCHHNLEHYYRHDVPRVLAGFLHVLKPTGFAQIHVPDMADLMRIVVRQNYDIDDKLYDSMKGPVTVRDVIYGYAPEIEESGQDFYAHKTGFTQKSLISMLQRCGFPYIYIGTSNLDIGAYAFKNAPTEEIRVLLGLPAPQPSVL